MAGQAATIAVIAALFGRAAKAAAGGHSTSRCSTARSPRSRTTWRPTWPPARLPRRRGSEGNGGVPSQLFPCVDGGLMVVCGSEPSTGSSARCSGRPELAGDPRSRTTRGASRTGPSREVFGGLTATGKDRRAAGRAGCGRHPLRAGQSLSRVFADPQVAHRGMTVTVDHVQAGPVGCARVRSASPQPRSARRWRRRRWASTPTRCWPTCRHDARGDRAAARTAGDLTRR